jgi:hypothetical protein
MESLSTIDPETAMELVGLIVTLGLLLIFKLLKLGRFKKPPPK